MDYKNIFAGELGLVKTLPLRMDLSTCVGTIIYGDNLVGVSHGLVPEGITRFSGNDVSVPRGIKNLFTLILANGENKDNLNAILLGGRGDYPIGQENASQARNILRDLGVPIKKDLSGSYFDQVAMIYQDRFEVKVPEFSHVLSLRYKDLK